MKNFFYIAVLLFVLVSACASNVENSVQGIANASTGDRIIRSDGERVVLTQEDIDYAQRQLELNPDTPTTTETTAATTVASDIQNRLQEINNSISIKLLIFLALVAVLIIIIGICVYTITSVNARKSGMVEKDARKLGVSTAVLAGIAAIIIAVFLLEKAIGINLVQMFLL